MADTNDRSGVQVGNGTLWATAEVIFNGNQSKTAVGALGILSGTQGNHTLDLIPGGAGNVTAGTSRMTLAGDDPAVVSLAAINGKLPALGQALAAASVPVVLTAAQISTLTPTGNASETTLATRLSESDFDTKIGSLTETAPATDTASSGLNGRLQRIAQRFTSFLALIPAALTGSGNFKVSLQESNASQAVTGNLGITGDALTSLQLIDDTVKLEGGNFAAGSDKLVMIGGNSTLGKAVPVAIDNFTRGFHVVLKDASGGDGGAIFDGSFNLLVSSVLRAGSASIGKLGANAGVNIGSVGIASGNVGITGNVTLAANSGVIVGAVEIASAQTLATVTTVSTVTNLSQMGGVAIAMGTGARSSGTQRVTIATDDVVPASQSGTWNIATVTTLTTCSTVTNLSQLGGQAIAMGTGTRSAGTQRVTIATDDVVPASQSGAWSVTVNPGTSGGCSPYSFLSTAAVQAAQLKGSAGQVYGMQFFNNSATIAYVRIYNQTGTPATTDAANIVWRGMIPASTDAAGFTVPLPGPIACGTGIGIRVTAAVADNDDTALSANVIMGNVQYK